MSDAAAALALVAVLACACAGTPAADGPTPARTSASGPVIHRLDPDRGPAGMAYPVRLTIEGRRFAAEDNTVRFGPVTLTGVPAEAGGTRIVLYAPKEAPGTGEVPPSPLLPGPYEVTVTTAAGTSPPAVFTLEGGP